MKKLDKLILSSFLGPFILTFFVVIFILLSQFMLKYFDEIVGKDLSFDIIAQLIFYFSIFMTPNAFPLAVLLSCLMTYGNLGQHFELTAIKGAGISLIRTLVPIFIFSVLLSIAAYFSNNYIVPRANLKAFSLLYDVKQKKPAMEIKEGTFYNGIDGYSIKINKKYPDGRSLKDLIIYDHTQGNGNRNVILADSGQMYNILDNRYLILELFNGHSYSEQDTRRSSYRSSDPEPFVRNNFKQSKMAFSMASFDLKRTKEELFAGNRLMKNTHQLKTDIDSMRTTYTNLKEDIQDNSFGFFEYHMADVLKQYRERALQRENERRKRELEEAEKKMGQKSHINNSTTSINEPLSDSAGIDIETKTPYSIDLAKVKNIKLPTDTNKMASLKNVNANQGRSSAIFNQKNIESVTKTGKTTINKRITKQKKILSTDSVSKNESLIAKGSVNDKQPLDSLENQVDSSKTALKKIDSLFQTQMYQNVSISRSLAQVRHVKNRLMIQTDQLEKLKTETNKFELERYKKLSYAITILMMFLIGAPLGAIIKKGGLGIPVLISIMFFILFYVISMICEKWTRQDVMDPFLAAWMANIILFPIGLFLLRQAKNDARLLETDFYSVLLFNLKKKYKRYRNKVNLKMAN